MFTAARLSTIFLLFLTLGCSQSRPAYKMKVLSEPSPQRARALLARGASLRQALSPDDNGDVTLVGTIQSDLGDFTLNPEDGLHYPPLDPNDGTPGTPDTVLVTEVTTNSGYSEMGSCSVPTDGSEVNCKLGEHITVKSASVDEASKIVSVELTGTSTSPTMDSCITETSQDGYQLKGTLTVSSVGCEVYVEVKAARSYLDLFARASATLAPAYVDVCPSEITFTVLYGGSEILNGTSFDNELTTFLPDTPEAPITVNVTYAGQSFTLP